MYINTKTDQLTARGQKRQRGGGVTLYLPPDEIESQGHNIPALVSAYLWIIANLPFKWSLHNIKWCWWVTFLIISRYHSGLCSLFIECPQQNQLKTQKAKKNNAGNLMHGVAGLLRQDNKSSMSLSIPKCGPRVSPKNEFCFVVSEKKKKIMDH